MATNQSMNSGIFGSDITSTQRVRDVAKEIYNINEGEDELLQLTMSRSKRGASKVVPVNSRKFEFNEQRLPNRFVTITGVAGDVLTVSTADFVMIRPGMVLRRDLSTAVRVLTAAANTSVTLVAGQGAGVLVGDVFIVVGNAGAEGAAFPSPIYFAPSLQYNYLQEISHAYEVTRWLTTEARYDRAGDLAKNRKDVLFYHKIQANSVLWMGHIETGTDSNGAQVLGTKGILESIQSNVGTFTGGIVTFQQLRQMIGDYTLKSKSKVLDLYVSPDVWGLLDDLWFGKQQINAPVITEAGVSMRKMSLGPKNVNIIQCVLFQTGTNFSNIMVGIDPAYFEIKTGKDQETGRVQWMLEFTQKPEELGSQVVKQTFVTDIAANLVAEEAHFIATNAVAVA